MATSWPKSLDTLYGGCEYFGKRVAEITDNKFQIQVFAAGEIVPGLQVLDAVQNGTVEIGNSACYYYVGKDPAFTFGTALPFGLNTRQMNAWQRMPMGASAQRVVGQLQRVGHGYRQYDGQMGGLFRKEIKSVDDLSGLKLRIGALLEGGSARSAWCRSSWPPATSFRRWKKARSTPPNGSALMTTRSSASSRWLSTTYYPGWWEGGVRSQTCRQSCQVERSSRSLPGARSRRAAGMRGPGCRRRSQSRSRYRLVATAPSCVHSRSRSLRRATRRRTSFTPRLADQSDVQEGYSIA